MAGFGAEINHKKEDKSALNKDKRNIISRDSAKGDCFFAVILNVLLCICLAIYAVNKGAFYTNDEVLMRSIASGDFTGTPDGHLVYVAAVLGWIMAGLYKVIPAVPWYDVFMLGFRVSSIGFLSYGAVKAWKKVKSQSTNRVELTRILLIAPFAVICGVDLSMVIYSQYTVIAAILMSVAILWMGIAERKNDYVISSVFTVLSLLVRKQVFLMGVPLLLLVTAWKIIREWSNSKTSPIHGQINTETTSVSGQENSETASASGQEKSETASSSGQGNSETASASGQEKSETILTPDKKIHSCYGGIKIYALATIAACVFVLIFEKFSYSSEGWQEYLEFNEYRTQMEDYYGMPLYQGNEEYYNAHGMIESDYQAMVMQNLSLVNQLDVDTVKGFAKIGEDIYAEKRAALGFSYPLYRLKRCLNELRYQPVGMMLIIFSTLILVLGIITKEWLSIVALICTGAYQAAFSWYFLYLDRFPERVSYGLYFMEMVVLFTVCVPVLKKFAGNIYFKIEEKDISDNKSKSGAIDNKKGFSLAKNKTGDFPYRRGKSILQYMILGVMGIASLALIYRFYVIQDYRIGLHEKENVASINEWSAIGEYASNHADAVYLISAPISNFTSDRMIAEGYKENPDVIALSYWTAGSPVLSEKKAVNGLNSLSEALLCGKLANGKLIFIVEPEEYDHGWLVDFYEGKGVLVTLDTVDIIDGGERNLEVIKICK